MDDATVNVSIKLIKVGVFLYDFITYPFYAIVQQPWRKQKQSYQLKSEQVAGTEGVTYKSVLPITNAQIEIEKSKIVTLVDVLKFSTKRFSDKNALGTRKVFKEFNEVQKNGKVFKKYEMGDYSWVSYSELDEMSSNFGKGLRAIGHQPRENLVIFSETRSQWLISAMGAFKQSIRVCTLYSTLGEEALIHGINETEGMGVKPWYELTAPADLLSSGQFKHQPHITSLTVRVRHLVVSHELLPKIKSILPQCPKVRKLIYLPDQVNPTETQGFEDCELFSFDKIVELGQESNIGDTLPSANDIAIIMYTSGSTGTPKGVIITHNNLVKSISGYAGVLAPKKRDIYLAYLPLAHVLELIGESIMLMLGVPMGYSSPLTMTDRSTKVKRGCKGDVSVLHPTIVPCVPLILDRIYKGILEKVASQGPFLKALFEFGVQYRLNWYSRGWETPICNWFVFRKIRALLGGKVRIIATGGAPLSPDTQNFIRASLGCPVIQGYGLTETCGCATLMLPSDTSVGRVGGPLTVNDIRLVNWEEGNYRVSDRPNPRGEVIVGGDNITIGYYKNPQKTSEDYFEMDGRRWFKTGDIGEIETDGCLKIIDRKKDLVKLQFGEYVSLGKVEAELKVCPLLENICVYADPLKNSIVAIATPDAKKLMEIAMKFNKNEDDTLQTLCNDKDIVNEFLKQITIVGKKAKLEKFELPSALYLTKDQWTPDSGLVTAAFKLRRKPIQIKYQDQIDRMYGA